MKDRKQKQKLSILIIMIGFVLGLFSVFFLPQAWGMTIEDYERNVGHSFIIYSQGALPFHDVVTLTHDAAIAALETNAIESSFLGTTSFKVNQQLNSISASMFGTRLTTRTLAITYAYVTMLTSLNDKGVQTATIHPLFRLNTAKICEPVYRTLPGDKANKICSKVQQKLQESVKDSQNIISNVLAHKADLQESIIGIGVNNPPLYFVPTTTVNMPGTTHDINTYNVNKFVLFKLFNIDMFSVRSVRKIHIIVLGLLILWGAFEGIVQGNSIANIFQKIVYNLGVYVVGSLFLYYIVYYLLSSVINDTIMEVLTSWVVAMNNVMLEFTIWGDTHFLMAIFSSITILILRIVVVFWLLNTIINFIAVIVIINVEASIAFILYPFTLLNNVPGIKIIAQVVENLINKMFTSLVSLSLVSILLPILTNIFMSIVSTILSYNLVMLSVILELIMVFILLRFINKMFADIWQKAITLSQ